MLAVDKCPILSRIWHWWFVKSPRIRWRIVWIAIVVSWN